VIKARKLWIWLLATGAAIVGLAAIPVASAQADTCLVTVTLVSGQKETFSVQVPAGTPLSAISLPVTGPVASMSESCTSTATTSTGTTPTTTGTATQTTPTTTTTTPKKTTSPSSSTSPSKHKAASGGGKVGTSKGSSSTKRSGKSSGAKSSSHSSSSTSAAKKPSKPPVALHGAGGVPSTANPTYSFALPGAAPLGVPNFFIDSFQIPPFLLPIYQAAGIEYDVPWQVLAAINWIETDYGRNLSVSTAGAVGWMQFLPSTWKRYGVDATGSGYADPYNPTDAIFAAARYLQAAGGSTNISKAIFAYNHASWYVQSVLLRAQLIGGMPAGLIGALTGLVEGHFPVAAPAKYADDSVEKLAKERVEGSNAALPIESTAATGTSIYAAQDSPVIAVNDGKIVKIGRNATLGRFIVLQDQTGNTYTYAHLGSIPQTYPVPRPVRITAADIAKELSIAPAKGAGSAGVSNAGTSQAPAPTEPATAGSQPSGTAGGGLARAGIHSAGRAHSPGSKGSSLLSLSLAPVGPQSHARAAATAKRSASGSTAGSPLVKERLFANPARPASYAAGGEQQLSDSFEISQFKNYFADVLHLGKNQYTLAPLKPGAIVVAGTILGRIGAPTRTSASHLYFMIQPAGRNAPYIDPKPILDGWKLLEATAVYRAAGINPFLSTKNASIGQILLESKQQLETRVLADPHAQIYACGRRDIQAGLIDRRILASIEYLTSSGLDPSISGLACGAGSGGATGIDAAGRTGSSMDISAINGIPIQGHQGPGTITDITIRRLLTLQGALAPNQIISEMSYKGQPSTLSLPDHANRIQVAFTPQYGANKALSGKLKSILKPQQWIQLIQRISQIPEPAVPTGPSKYAIRTGTTG
jgi:hypothetical protein